MADISGVTVPSEKAEAAKQTAQEARDAAQEAASSKAKEGNAAAKAAGAGSFDELVKSSGNTTVANALIDRSIFGSTDPAVDSAIQMILESNPNKGTYNPTIWQNKGVNSKAGDDLKTNETLKTAYDKDGNLVLDANGNPVVPGASYDAKGNMIPGPAVIGSPTPESKGTDPSDAAKEADKLAIQGITSSPDPVVDNILQKILQRKSTDSEGKNTAITDKQYDLDAASADLKTKQTALQSAMAVVANAILNHQIPTPDQTKAVSDTQTEVDSAQAIVTDTTTKLHNITNPETPEKPSNVVGGSDTAVQTKDVNPNTNSSNITGDTGTPKTPVAPQPSDPSYLDYIMSGLKGTDAAVNELGRVSTGLNANIGNNDQMRASNLSDSDISRELQANYEKLAGDYTTKSADYDTAVKESLGANAGDYIKNATAAAQPVAEQQAQAQTTADIRNRLRAARTAGQNTGVSALQASQSAGDVYTGAYQSELDKARSQYQTGVGLMSNEGQNLAGRSNAASNISLGQNAATRGSMNNAANNEASSITARSQQGQIAGTQGNLSLNKASTAGNIDLGQKAAEQSKINAANNYQLGKAASDLDIGKFITNTVTGGAAYVLDALGNKVPASTTGSDKNIKQNIKPTDDTLLKQLVAKVKPVSFNYNDKSGEDTTKNRTGVLAQDLEKTDLKDNVIDTPSGKQVIDGQQTLSNTNLIIQLAQKMFELEAELKAMKGNK